MLYTKSFRTINKKNITIGAKTKMLISFSARLRIAFFVKPVPKDF